MEVMAVIAIYSQKMRRTAVPLRTAVVPDLPTGEGEIDTARDPRQLMISYYTICGFTAMPPDFNDKMKVQRRSEGSRPMDEGSCCGLLLHLRQSAGFRKACAIRAQ